MKYILKTNRWLGSNNKSMAEVYVHVMYMHIFMNFYIYGEMAQICPLTVDFLTNS